MFKKFQIDIEPEVFDDIQDAVDYYISQKRGLGKRFFQTIDKHFTFLKKNYSAFAFRYDNIRCMPVKKFPYMIHYRVLESQQIISIKAVFNTNLNPEKWKERVD